MQNQLVQFQVHRRLRHHVAAVGVDCWGLQESKVLDDLFAGQPRLLAGSLNVIRPAKSKVGLIAPACAKPTVVGHGRHSVRPLLPLSVSLLLRSPDTVT